MRCFSNIPVYKSFYFLFIHYFSMIYCRFSIFTFSLMLLFCGKTHCQEKEIYSAEISSSVKHYFLGNENKNGLNLGLSIQISKYINKLKVSSGASYSLKSYYNELEPLSITNYLKGRDYRVAYVNFPIIASATLFSVNTFAVSLGTGLEFNKVIDFRITSHYVNNKSSIEELCKSLSKFRVVNWR